MSLVGDELELLLPAGSKVRLRTGSDFSSPAPPKSVWRAVSLDTSPVIRSSSARGLLRSWRTGPDVNMNFNSPAVVWRAGSGEPVEETVEESDSIFWSGELVLHGTAAKVRSSPPMGVLLTSAAVLTRPRSEQDWKRAQKLLQRYHVQYERVINFCDQSIAND